MFSDVMVGANWITNFLGMFLHLERHIRKTSIDCLLWYFLVLTIISKQLYLRHILLLSLMETWQWGMPLGGCFQVLGIVFVHGTWCKMHQVMFVLKNSITGKFKQPNYICISKIMKLNYYLKPLCYKSIPKHSTIPALPTTTYFKWHRSTLSI